MPVILGMWTSRKRMSGFNSLNWSGKLVMRRLVTPRGKYGVLPSEEVVIQVFEKAQAELVKGKSVSDDAMILV